MKWIIIIVALSLPALSARAENVCETSFDKEVSPISQLMHEGKKPNRWKSYAAFLKKFGPCLDGTYAETVQEISEIGLAKDWNGFSEFVTNEHPDPKILRNIRIGFSPDMGSIDRLKEIQKNAKEGCPKHVKEFCSEILKVKL